MSLGKTDSHRLAQTVLHDWHVDKGARMVDFSGWHMPVQYKTGIIGEHLATRHQAGLFDVCHMGRIKITGTGAERFLLRVLTNNTRRLSPGQAQYTFIPTETGGAVDDAYLYKLAEEEFLLVVNAANRQKDWAWFQQQMQRGDLEIEDSSKELGMLSLQGPESSAILEQIVGKEQLPENKRNRVSIASFDGHQVIVARTGYTGESICFELFPETDYTVELWQRLVALGAVPVGLGARDSLRLEAGLPLYGHELGRDPEENEIPIFANGLAISGVRASGGDYIGSECLERQRCEFIQIQRGELSLPLDQRILKRLVQPIAVFGGKRPLRAGYKIYQDGQHVGYVTSGTSVPYCHFYGEGVTATPSGKHDVRPIGLALIDSTLCYRPDRPVMLQVVDNRKNSFDAELVEHNLWPVAPFSRTYTGFHAPETGPQIDASGVAEYAARLKDETRQNTEWRQARCVNLIPSEQCTSRYVDKLCSADPSGRYNEHKCLRALGPDAPEVRYYKGTKFIMDKEEELKAALRTFFDCSRVEVRVISGQMANETVYDALKQFKNRYRRGKQPESLRALVHDLSRGGHLSAQVSGALKNYVAIDPVTERPTVEQFPMRTDDPYQIDLDATKELILNSRPELLVFGRSVMIHKEPVREIAEFVYAEYGQHNPSRPLIMYDGAHVLGLLGKYFQDPLKEGADVITGSTHKTFFGPQRGVVLSNIEPGSPFDALWGFIESRAFPGHVSNHHLGTLLGLLGATCEMLQFKDEYPRQVIDNAKAFAAALHQQGLAIEGDRSYGFTETHQVLLRAGRANGGYLADLLEKNNIITNPQGLYDDPSFAAASGIRMGTQEMTRYGMKEKDFRGLAALIAEIVSESENKPAEHWRGAVELLRRQFVQMHYCF